MNIHFQSAHPEDPHYISRSVWLRAAVLGANDGIVSISSLIVGVAAAESSSGSILIAGLAGLVAGAMSMAAGEYVSVSSQSDIETADIEREKEFLETNSKAEFAELIEIYELRGLTRTTAELVAHELTGDDPLRAHVRDELGLSEIHAANPIQAAFASALTFSLAGSIPLLAAYLAAADTIIVSVLIATLIALAVLGATGAKLGGAPIIPASIRVLVWGSAAMAVTAGVGWLFGVAVA
ncbi:VIT family protein [Pararhizobium sp. IMCC21322]|uniref:VIT1/CCC1 transporter family protein n=1 Tax=Pararhizobium sp. IMCC21322 TaxID=3067903 RepID=UPI002741B657|nr:VIT family protein [Pararhizobium sp. IMCC21322]